MSGELPAGWSACTLGDIVERIETGKSVKCDERPPLGEENGLVKISAVTWGTFNEQESKTLFDSSHLKPEEKIQLGDFLISRANTLELVGSCVIVKKLSKNLYLSDKVLRLALAEMSKPWLLTCLRTQNGRKQIESLATGNQFSMRNISQQALKEIRIQLPPIAEQTRIAQKLDELLAQVDTLKARIDGIPALLKRFRQSVLAAAVSGRLTEEWRAQTLSLISLHTLDAEAYIGFAWPEVSLGDVAQDFSYGSSAKSKPSGDTPVLRMGNIQGGRLDWDDLVFSTDQEEIKKYALHAGDVLFNRTNSPALVGKTAIYKDERPAIYAGYLIRIRCSKQLNADFLNYCLNSPQGKHYCWQVKTDGVSQSNINAKKLAAFRFGLPSIEEQTEIVRRVEQLFAFADQLEAKVASAKNRIDHLTPSILAKAFRGELVPQDPNDEPASVLLERIKAQRAAAPKAKRGRKSA